MARGCRCHGDDAGLRRIPGTKEPVAPATLAPAVEAALRADQHTLHDQALARHESASPFVESVDHAKPITHAGFVCPMNRRFGPGGVLTLTGVRVTLRYFATQGKGYSTNVKPIEELRYSEIRGRPGHSRWGVPAKRPGRPLAPPASEGVNPSKAFGACG